MKFRFFLVASFALSSSSSFAQTTLIKDKLEVKQSLKLTGKTVTGISSDTTNASKSDVKLITEKAAKRYADLKTFSLTNGSGTTASTNKINLGGNLTASASIYGNQYDFNFFNSNGGFRTNNNLGISELGANEGQGNETKVVVDDNNQRVRINAREFLIKENAKEYFKIDPNAAYYGIGDLGNNSTGTRLEIEESYPTIKATGNRLVMEMGGSKFLDVHPNANYYGIGDVDEVNQGTALIIEDNRSFVNVRGLFKQNYTVLGDANTDISNGGFAYIELPNITANRTIILPTANSDNIGVCLRFLNRNSNKAAINQWTFNTAVARANGSSFTNLQDEAWTVIVSNGTNWILMQ